LRYNREDMKPAFPERYESGNYAFGTLHASGSVGSAVQITEVVDYQEEVQVHSNPANPEVNVRWKENALATILSSPTHIAPAHFDVASLSEGLYFLRLEVEGKRAVVDIGGGCAVVVWLHYEVITFSFSCSFHFG
jgi:hypothetical protein